MASSSSLGPFSPSPPSLIPVMKEGECRNWAELPSELTSSILRRLDSIDLLENAQKVCTSWYRVCKDPEMWRKIDMRNSGNLGLNLETMCRHAVDRSKGGLVEIDIWHFGTDSLLNYIADSSSNLNSLRLAICSLTTTDGLTEAIVKIPLLEELEVSYCSLSAESLKVVGQSCPNLKTLKLNREAFSRFHYVSDDDALAIAETMPRLSHLQLFGNKLSDAGLNAILDNCPDLEHLDLRRCYNLNLFGDLKKRCSERVKVLRGTYDLIWDYPYDESVICKETYQDPYSEYYSYDSSSDSDYSDYDYDSYYNDDVYDPFKKKMASSSSYSPPLSASVPQLMKREEPIRNWSELPPELISSILLRLNSIEILEKAQKVCRSWRRVCKDPSMWRKIDMYNDGDLGSMGYDLEIMCRQTVDRSQGGLLEIDLWYFGTDKLPNYIADRSSNLRSLRLIMCYPIADEGFVEAVAKLPLLEYLEITYGSLSGESLKVAGQSCPNLKTLRLNSEPDPKFYDEECNDEEALGIAESMPELRHLQLFGNILTNTGLTAILDGCPLLEHLDLRKCFNIRLEGDLEKRCSERIKELKRPDDSTAGHPYGFNIEDLSGPRGYYWDEF
ncbi:unnamed protein product [Eruca vesicaria subsp. sativa]|uniref:F-box domain-containing protein n=1 Tax=Eruca vesicaria subsp. sativa TaxID=29727 RepID=A0ABC8KIK1_ERUVS|nr:unnamed protein product [Eruca vesicaria subsp. sativa]